MSNLIDKENNSYQTMHIIKKVIYLQINLYVRLPYSYALHKLSGLHLTINQLLTNYSREWKCRLAGYQSWQIECEDKN